LFHDTGVKEGGFGVWRFWAVMKERYPLHFEMHHAFGLGVIQIPPTSETEVLPWLLEGNEFKYHLSKSFAALGQFQIDRFESTLTQKHVYNLEGIIASLETIIASLETIIASKDTALTLKQQELDELSRDFFALNQHKSEKIQSPQRPLFIPSFYSRIL